MALVSVKVAGGDISVEKLIQIFGANLRAEGCVSKDFQLAVMTDILSVDRSEMWSHARLFTVGTTAQLHHELLSRIVHIRARIQAVRLANTRDLSETWRHHSETPARMAGIPENLHRAIQAIVGPADVAWNGAANGAPYGETNHRTDPATKQPKTPRVTVKEYYLTVGGNRAAQPYRFTSRRTDGKVAFYYSASHVGNSYQYRMLCDNAGVPVIRDVNNNWGDSYVKKEI
jgi:hypothetical protein